MEGNNKESRLGAVCSFRCAFTVGIRCGRMEGLRTAASFLVVSTCATGSPSYPTADLPQRVDHVNVLAP